MPKIFFVYFRVQQPDKRQVVATILNTRAESDATSRGRYMADAAINITLLLLHTTHSVHTRQQQPVEVLCIASTLDFGQQLVLATAPLASYIAIASAVVLASTTRRRPAPCGPLVVVVRISQAGAAYTAYSISSSARQHAAMRSATAQPSSFALCRDQSA